MLTISTAIGRRPDLSPRQDLAGLLGPHAAASDGGPVVNTTTDTGLDVVTGAFSYSGAAMAHALRDGAAGAHPHRTPERAPTGTSIYVHPLDFDDRWASWRRSRRDHPLQHVLGPLRLSHLDHELAVVNSTDAFHAAERAGVQRIVHVSITHPSVSSPWPYFRGKALVERALAECGVSYAIVGPPSSSAATSAAQQHRLAAAPAAGLRHRRAG